MTNRIATTAALLVLAFGTSAGAQTMTGNPVDQSLAGPTGASTLYLTGTVVSSDASKIVVRADDGKETTILINDSTAEPKLFEAGDRVRINYTSLSAGHVARSITDLGTVTTTTTVTPTTETTTKTISTPVGTASATVTETATDTDVDVDVDPATETAAVDTDNEADTMPATASPLALIALLGLGAAGAASAVRRNRKS
jgi:hypothetical protein